MSIDKLHYARVRKNDEFYTCYEDIENEINNYYHSFAGKTVYCNCDNPKYSNFWKFFHSNFSKLKLKKIICTYYDANDSPICAFYEGGNDTDCTQYESYLLIGDGDFRSEECIELLNKSDIICTNPPFSLFRDFVDTMIEYKKHFLVIGNMNSVNYLVPYIRDGLLWVGKNSTGGTRAGNSMYFIVPQDYEGTTYEVNGTKMACVGAWWYTNIDFKQRHKKLKLECLYNPIEYPTYENYKAINVDRSKKIPKDYFGVIGVPISFLNGFWCPEQFRVIGITQMEDTCKEVEELRTDPKRHHFGIINGKNKYPRILIQRIGEKDE